MTKMLTGWAVGLALLTALMVWVLPKDDLEAKTSYRVDPQTLALTLVDGRPGRYDDSIWELVLNLLPHDYLRHSVTRFSLFSDGVQDALAYVQQTDYEANAWTLAVDRRDYRLFREFVFVSTIVHEFAHLFSLSRNQFAHFQWGCNSLRTRGGCFKTEAYLNQWYQQFWVGEVETAHQQMVASVKKDFRADAQTQFFETFSDAFVSEYASSNVSEDFAESLAQYVLRDTLDDERPVIQQKLQFFSLFPELVNVRAHIRARIAALDD